MAIDAKNLVVAAKVYSRGVALPLDASSVYESLGEAQSYAQNPSTTPTFSTAKLVLTL